VGVFRFFQIFICGWGSLFSVAVVLSSSRRIRGMSLTVIFLSLINSAIFLCFPSWQLIVLGFTVLQFGRAAIGARTLVLESAK